MTSNSKTTDRLISMRRRLNAIIADQDTKRGRPLTDREKLDNLAAALAADDTECPLCAKRDNERCGYETIGEVCRL